MENKYIIFMSVVDVLETVLPLEHNWTKTRKIKDTAFVVGVVTFAFESSSANPAGACANISPVLIHARCT